uniref:Uncharacterized protein n=2 Tax=Cacopsylla melanoneura TaxID=428564 RepID=A0A8D8M8T6_9HEMI
MVEMGTETTASMVERWAQQMGLPVDNFTLFYESINDPVMRGAWSHIVQHVCPKQEIQQINQLIADYEFHKLNPGSDVEVSVHKPEDVILYKKREHLLKILQEKRKEEALLDEEKRMSLKHLQEKRNTNLSLKRTIKSKQHKSNMLRLKQLEMTETLQNVKECNQKINNILNSEQVTDKDRVLVLIKMSIKQLMAFNTDSPDLNSAFWKSIRQEWLTHSPPVVIQGALTFCQELCASIDALLYTRCEPQTMADFSPVNDELASMRSELEETYEQCEKLKLAEQQTNKMPELFEEINQLLLKNESNPDIGRVKADRFRESIEYESLLAQVEYLRGVSDSCGIETQSDTTQLELSTDQKAEVKNTIQMMESTAQLIFSHIAQFEDITRLFHDLKSHQNECLAVMKDHMSKLPSLELHKFHNKLVQVHTWLVQISDDHYSNKIDNFQKDTGATNLKQIQHLLATLCAMQDMTPLPDVSTNDCYDTNTETQCQLPDSLNDDVLDTMDERLKKITQMFEYLGAAAQK